MSQFTEYITKEGERWDAIAYNAYGDVGKVSILVQNNPNIPITPRLPSGLRMLIPILPTAKSVANKDLLPPWKR